MNITEVVYGSGLDISKSTKIGTVDGLEVFQMDLGNGTCYFLFHPGDQTYLSYVATDNKKTNNYLHLRQIENVSGIKGSLSALMYFLTKKQNFKFIITNNEPLTVNGLNWIVRTINSGRKLFNFTDINGQSLDIKKLTKEYEDSQIDPQYQGKISIVIESHSGNGFNKIFESFESYDGLLMPMYRIFKDEDLD